MTSIPPLQDSNSQVKCAQCGEDLIASMWSGHVSVTEVRHFWCCGNCGYMFDTLDPTEVKEKLPTELAEEFLPSLLVA